MSDLEKLVTGNLVGETKEETPTALPPLRVLEQSERLPQKQLLELCREFPVRAEKDPASTPYLAVQLLAYLQGRVVLNSSNGKSALTVMALAATYAQEPSSQLLQELRDWTAYIEDTFARREDERLEKIAIGNTLLQVDYLREAFEDDLAKELAEITRVRTPTAKRWIEGANMNWRNAQKISVLARIFYSLQNGCGLSKEEARKWYVSEWRDAGHTPKDLLLSYTYAPPVELRQLLTELSQKKL